jgi:two-component system phosphate regulon sensor histidine kinase PhoR
VRSAGSNCNRGKAGDPTAQVLSLLKASSDLVSVLNPHELFERLVLRVVEALPSVHGGILWIHDGKVGRLRAMATSGLPIDDATEQSLLSLQLRIGEGLAGSAWQRAEAQFCQTSRGYRDTGEQFSSTNQPVVQHLSEQWPNQIHGAAIPLRVGNEMIGVLELPQPG